MKDDDKLSEVGSSISKVIPVEILAPRFLDDIVHNLTDDRITKMSDRHTFRHVWRRVFKHYFDIFEL